MTVDRELIYKALCHYGTPILEVQRIMDSLESQSVPSSQLRDEIIMECAAVADSEWIRENSLIGSKVARKIANGIRDLALKSAATPAATERTDSPTPRVDAIDDAPHHNGYPQMLELARQLERELAEAHNRIQKSCEDDRSEGGGCPLVRSAMTRRDYCEACGYTDSHDPNCPLSRQERLANKIEQLGDDGGEGTPFDQDELDMIVKALRPSPSVPPTSGNNEPVAYAVRVKSDGSFFPTIAPVNYLMFKERMKVFEEENWVIDGRAEIVPLFLASSATEKVAADSAESPSASACKVCGATPPFHGGTRCQRIDCGLIEWTRTPESAATGATAAERVGDDPVSDPTTSSVPPTSACNEIEEMVRQLEGEAACVVQFGTRTRRDRDAASAILVKAARLLRQCASSAIATKEKP